VSSFAISVLSVYNLLNAERFYSLGLMSVCILVIFINTFQLDVVDMYIIS